MRGHKAGRVQQKDNNEKQNAIRQSRIQQRYELFLKKFYWVVSCFTLLYCFCFTQSYTEISKEFTGCDKSYAENQENNRIYEEINFSESSNLLTLLNSLQKESFQIDDFQMENCTDYENRTEIPADSQNITKKTKLLPCGIPVGIYMETNGVLVSQVVEVYGKDGKMVAPCAGLIEAGDYILKINQKEAKSKEQFKETIQQCNGEPVTLEIERNDKKQEVVIHPVLTETEGYIAGLWIRDNMHGIGTLTWVDENDRFGALGHCISDVDSGNLLKIREGALYQAEVYSLIKGSPNRPGSLAGAIDYRTQSWIGTIETNQEQGIFGTGNETLKKMLNTQLKTYYKANSFEEVWEKGAMEIASAEEIQNGSAQILNCFEGSYQLYDITIQKINEKKDAKTINMEITVTDSHLLEQTGGILQGMSGSPIVQNGKLIGAVTHVLVNDPTRGYGIFIENMLDAAE